jgi:hypothetical protein
MFEGSNTEGDSLADTDSDLYILGIKYRTPDGKPFERVHYSIDVIIYAIKIRVLFLTIH